MRKERRARIIADQAAIEARAYSRQMLARAERLDTQEAYDTADQADADANHAEFLAFATLERERGARVDARNAGKKW